MEANSEKKRTVGPFSFHLNLHGSADRGLATMDKNQLTSKKKSQRRMFYANGTAKIVNSQPAAEPVIVY